MSFRACELLDMGIQYLISKIGDDTGESEPLKVCPQLEQSSRGAATHLQAAAYAAATGSYGQIVEAALPAQQVLPPVEAAQHACKEGT